MEEALRQGSRQGVRQRAAARDAAARKPSSLAEHLYNQQCWGQLSLAQVRDIAVRACDGFAAAGAAPPPDLQMLGQLGESRAETHNLWRDLQRRTVKPFLEPCWENIPLSMGERQLRLRDPQRSETSNLCGLYLSGRGICGTILAGVRRPPCPTAAPRQSLA